MQRVQCPQCGDVHDLRDMQVGYARPDAYFAVPRDEREARVTFTPDLADIDRASWFVRGVLEVPIVGEPQPFGWGIWVQVSEDAFARYADASRNGADATLPSFPGRVGTQLPGYPRTLGVGVEVIPSREGYRPTFIVTEESHPLAVEQRGGIPMERVLEHLWPFLHPGAPAPLGSPHVATIPVDGWELESGVARSRTHRDLPWIPDSATRESVRVGEFAKLIFIIEAATETGEAETHGERMWVEVDHVEGAGGDVRYAGVLTNSAHIPGVTRPGMRVWFGAEHVIDVQRADGSRASAGSGARR
ncbi:MAG TPA: DUF2199 domain-containing protein [Gemmatimonadaceae bacterium]